VIKNTINQQTFMIYLNFNFYTFRSITTHFRMSYPPEEWNILHDDQFMAFVAGDTSRPLTADVLLQLNRNVLQPAKKLN